MAWQDGLMRGEQWLLSTFTSGRLLTLSYNILLDKLRKCGLDEWTDLYFTCLWKLQINFWVHEARLKTHSATQHARSYKIQTVSTSMCINFCFYHRFLSDELGGNFLLLIFLSWCPWGSTAPEAAVLETDMLYCQQITGGEFFCLSVPSPFRLQEEVTAITRKGRKINGVYSTVEIRNNHTLQKGAFQRDWLKTGECRSQ